MPSEYPEPGEIVLVARLSARIILENGGETYRAEETAQRICRAFGLADAEVMALATGVFITASRGDSQAAATLKRIHKRGFNLTAVEEVNCVARQIAAGGMNLGEARERLNAIAEEKPRRGWVPVLAAGASSGCFALLFRGNGYDFLAATLCGMAVQLLAERIKIEDMFQFTVNFLGGFLLTAGALLFTRFTGTGSLDKIVTGAMMPLLPGVAMTNAIRDTIRGDLLSGVSRGAEALLAVASLAFGVGLALKLYFQFLA